MKDTVKLLVALLPGLLPLSAHSEPQLSVKGFGTAVLVGSDTDRIGFRRDTSQDIGARRNGSFEPDSRFGVQLDANFSDDWHAGIQWVARSHPGDFVEQNLDWAYLRWRPQPDLNVRVGRLGFDVFLLSEYRNVGYAYPWIRPPHEFYGGLPAYHFDGADVTRKLVVGDGFVTLKAFGGFSYYQVPATLSQIFDAASLVAGGSLVYELGDWRLRVGYTHTETLREAPLQALTSALNDPAVRLLWPGAAQVGNRFSVRGKVVQYSFIGMGYDDGTWLAQMEAAYIDSNFTFYPSGANGYLSLGRRVGPVTLYTLLGIAETFKDRIPVSQPLLPIPALVGFRDTVDAILNGNGVDQKSISLGVRWDVHENIALKAQWSHYWLGENGTQLWQEPFSGPTPREVNLWSLGVDFLF
ncbi:MAG: hypothetical protein FIA97_18030 [Methylococcaceae bacterium]|nr:hypothetical protein [Methylococcaceae bacterium]